MADGVIWSAERGGFEPPVQSPGQRFSRPPQSTTLASLRYAGLFSMADANIADFVVNSRRLSRQASVQLKKPLRIYRAVNM